MASQNHGYCGIYDRGHLSPFIASFRLPYHSNRLPAEIVIESNLAQATPPVLADSTQIYQIVINLATNAGHAMQGKPGILRIGLDSFFPDQSFVHFHPEFGIIPYTRLVVGDTGHGMDSMVLAHIFEPFFTTKPGGKGTGLGLAVVHGIVRSHDGFITVESQPGQGTTFCLYFPDQTRGTLSPENATRPSLPGQGQHVLLVDDEPALPKCFKVCCSDSIIKLSSATAPWKPLE